MASVQAVLGQVSQNLGCVLTHEHLSLNFEKFYVPPPDDIKNYFQKNIVLDNVGFIRQYPYSSHYNLKFDDNDTYEAVKQDILLYKKLKGGAIVENSSHGLERNLELMYEISKDCGIHIIAGTGHYVQAVQNQSTLQLRVEEMTDLYAREIMTGCEINNGKNIVKCGFIGEVGSSWPITDFEKHAIQATGEIQEVIGCGVSFHPGRDKKAPFEIIRLYLEAGGKANKCVMSHLERTIQDFDEVLEFAKLGTYLQYDLFGVECSYYQLNNEVDMPSDAQRINNVMKLVDEGLEDRILLSHDIHTKHRLINFGGHGYSHLQLNIIPRLFAKGLSIEQVDKITVKNPANWLAFKN